VRKHEIQTNCGGFSLVEVLIAIFILALGSLALFSTLGFSKNVQTEAVEINEAGQIANAVLESFRNAPFIVLEDAVPAGTYTVASLQTVYDSELKPYHLIEPGLVYQIQQKLTERRMTESIQVENSPDAMRVSVSIFRQQDQVHPLVNVAIFIAKNGINFR